MEQPQQSEHRRKRIHLLHACTLLLLSIAWLGCPHRALKTPQQLGGADPGKDLTATPQLKQFQKHKVTGLSVRGVKLLDPIERVFKLWGKPQNPKKNKYIWTDPQGTYTLRVLVGRKVLETPLPNGKRWRIVVRQIDIFTPFTAQLHPGNRSLLNPDIIRSPSWRNQTFGSQGKQKQTHLKEWFVFPKKGYRFMLLSRLLPLHKKVATVFSLFVPEEDLTQLRIIPLS